MIHKPLLPTPWWKHQKLPFIALTSCLLALSSASAGEATARIVGGTMALEGHYPWMTALVERGQPGEEGQFCGGTLIDSEWVVTAAHCAEGVTPNNTEVIVGAYDLRDGQSGQRVRISEVRMHSGYRPGDDSDISYDIALLRLSQPVTGVSPLPMVSDASHIAHGTMATAIGFGATSEDGEGSPTLREVEVPIVSLATANAHYGNLNNTHLPAGLAEGGRDSCYGDSGGPLLVKVEGSWHLAGITSFGDGCGFRGAYGIYAHVLNLRSWVSSQMEQPLANPAPQPDPDPAGEDEPLDSPFPEDASNEDPFAWEDDDFEDIPEDEWNEGNFGDEAFDWEFDFFPDNSADDHGDDPESATQVNLPSTTAGNLESPWDYDVFVFEVTTSALVTVETTGTTDTYGYLMDEASFYAEDDASGEQGNFRFTEPLEPGIYTLWIEAFDPSSQVGSYQLRLAVEQSAAAPPQLEVSDEEDQPLAAHATLDFGEHEVKRAAATRSLTLWNLGENPLLIENAQIEGADATLFRLTAQPGTQVASGRSTTLVLAYQPTRKGSHQAELVVTSNDPTQPAWSIQLTGTGLAPVAGNDDHGDDPVTATNLDGPGTATGTLDAGGDIDVFSFELTEAAKVILRTSGDLDTYGILMNAEGEIIAEDDDRGSGFNFRIRRRLDPGTYTIAVEGWDETVSGDYQLSLQVR